MTVEAQGSFTVPDNMDPVVLSVASTLLHEQGWGTPSDNESPLEWDTTNENSQITLMYAVVEDVMKTVARLENTFGPTLITTLISRARRLNEEEYLREAEALNEGIQLTLRDGSILPTTAASGEEKFWEDQREAQP